MSEPEYNLFDEAKVLADDRPSEEGNLLEWALDAEHMIRRLVKVFNSTPQAAQQGPDELRHIGEQDCLLDVDEEAWRSLVENRGGCRCHISPPCGACSNPISEEEMNEVGYTYTSPQPAQQEPVAWMQDSIELYVQDRPSEYYTIPLYTSPPAQRKPLTDEQIKQLASKHLDVGDGSYATHFVTGDVAFARAIEAAHNIKENT